MFNGIIFGVVHYGALHDIIILYFTAVFHCCTVVLVSRL